MPEWLGTGAAIAGIVSGVLAPLVLIGIYLALHPHIEKRLTNNAEYRAWRAEQLRSVAFGDLYLRSLERALAWLQEFMGPPWHPRAFGVCLTLTLVYSWIFLLGSWLAVGGEAGLAGAAFLPDVPGWQRGATVSAAILYIIALFYMLRWAIRKGGRAGPLAVVFGGAFAGALVFAGAVAFAVAVPGLVAVALAVAPAVAVAGAGPAVLAVPGGTVVAFAGGTWLLGSLELDDPAEAAALLFWLDLPVANAAWDWVSWWVSRALGTDLARKMRSASRSDVQKAWTGLWHGAVDLGAALVLLAALAWTLPNVVEWFLPVFADEAQWCRMGREPFGEGLWITLMLLSTLFPTALHLMAVLASPAAALALRYRQSPDVAATLLRANAMGDGSAYATYLQKPEFKRAVDQAAAYFALVRPAIWIVAAVLAFFGLWGLIRLIWLGLEGLLFFLPRIDSLPEFLLGVAYDFDFTKAAACFDGGRL